MLLLFHYFGKAVNLIACKQDAQTFDWAHFSSIINYIEQIKMHKPTSGRIILAQIFLYCVSTIETNPLTDPLGLLQVGLQGLNLHLVVHVLRFPVTSTLK